MYTTAFGAIGLAVGSLLHPVVAVLFTLAAGYFGFLMDRARAARKRQEAATTPSPVERAGERAQTATKPAGKARKRANASGHLRAYGGMYLDLDIVGESHRQDAIQKLWRGPDFTHTAVMIPEANNPYDSNAVRVEVEGVHVGYLSRETAEDYRGYMEDERCEVPVHFVKGGTKGTIGIFTGRSKADRDELRAAAAKNAKA